VNTPDLVGFTLESAKAELSKLNRDIRVSETFAPKEKTITGECRVVKQVICENWIELTVSYF
jgi:hypothetical protein